MLLRKIDTNDAVRIARAPNQTDQERSRGAQDHLVTGTEDSPIMRDIGVATEIDVRGNAMTGGTNLSVAVPFVIDASTIHISFHVPFRVSCSEVQFRLHTYLGMSASVGLRETPM